MIPIDAMKITSERLTTGIHDRLLMSLPVDFRYEYVANTKRKTEAPKHDAVIRIYVERKYSSNHSSDD